MTFKENFISYLEKPKTWFIILGVICFIILIIMISNKIKAPPNKPPSVFCPDPQVRVTCKDNSVVCADQCDEQKIWDCDTKKCICKPGTTSCVGGTVCCEVCNNNICCESDNQITDPTTGIKSCCNPGTEPDTTNGTKCVSVCGNGTCDPGQECVVITNLSVPDFNDLNSKYQSDTDWRGTGYDINNNPTVYLCHNKDSCSFNDSGAQVLPSAGDNYKTFYKMSGVGGNTNDELCLPNDGSTDITCYGKSETECRYNTNCGWVSIVDELSRDNSGYDHMKKKLTAWQAHNNLSSNGYYCGDSNNEFGRLEKIGQADDKQNCSWKNCVTRMANNGTTRVIWNSTDKTCSALIGGTTNGGLGSSVVCTGAGIPCTSCKQTGDIIPKSQCSDTTTTNSEFWDFKPCVTTPNNVLHFTGCDASSTCGNCPWGQNTKDSISTDPLDGLQHGESSSGVACYEDGQIKTPGVKYYSRQQSKSGHGIVCLPDTTCSTAGNGCFSDQSVCEGNPTKSVCDPTNGWFLNSTRDDCNIFACTTDGKIISHGSSNDPSKNQDNHFNFNSGDCYRKGPGINPNSRDRCRLYNVGLSCTSDTPQCSGVTDGWGNCACKLGLGQCNGSIQDTTTEIDGATGGPQYYYPYSPDSVGLHPCFSKVKPTGSQAAIDFDQGYPTYDKKCA
jgi:hypothetical protein